MQGIDLIDGKLDADLELVRKAAREAGELAMRYFRRDPQVWMKAGNSPVTEGDLAVDRLLRDRLSAARPDYGWLSEETADSSERLSALRTFVVDPIDGTRGFIAGSAEWCVSVAIVEDGEMGGDLGLVAQCLQFRAGDLDDVLRGQEREADIEHARPQREQLRLLFLEETHMPQGIDEPEDG